MNIETKGNRDKRINERYRHALDHGFSYITAEKLRSVFTSREMNIIKKDDCKPGCQVADLLAGPALRHIRFINTGHDPITGEYTKALCKILEDKKFYREVKDGRTLGPHGYGRIWRPNKSK